MSELPPTTAQKPGSPVAPLSGPDDTVALDQPAAADHVGAATTVVGRYRLIKVLGSGGMGAVWLAEQFDPVRRHVALKLIRAGLEASELRHRFEAEQQALSIMEHPNIAKVFDAGDHQGNPFFVMELVHGTPITRYCDENRLTLSQRLALFVPVCHAIHHAHLKNVVHRDIKPSNILVERHDERPVPKVIDFGVAKTLERPLGAEAAQTVGVLGTPEYMSPEQAGDDPSAIDARSDVYSLGVLLFEIVTGTTPVKAAGLKQKSLLDVLRAVRESEAPRPSSHLESSESLASLAADRGLEPARLLKECRGDLDWIILKALEKAPSRRYSTAEELAADVQRHLNGEPVSAHPPSVSYRLRKFRSKHRGKLLAAALVLLVGIGGIIASIASRKDPVHTEDPTLAIRREEVARRVESLMNSKPRPDRESPHPISIRQTPLPQNRSDFLVISDDRMIDLRAYNLAKPGSERFVIYHTRKIMTKVNPVHVWVGGPSRTRGPIVINRELGPKPDSAKAFQIEEADLVGGQSMRSWQLIHDVSGIPVDTEFVSQIQDTYWNPPLEGDEERWYGAVGYKGILRVSMLIVFPEGRPFSNFTLRVAPIGESQPVPYEGPLVSFKSDANSWLYWEIPKPEAGHVYRVDWNW